jgi:hypothetical protein
MDTVSLLVVPVRTRSGMASIQCGRPDEDLLRRDVG